MRETIFCYLLIFLLGCSNSKYPGLKTDSLYGTWKPIKLEIGGQQLPQESFASQKLILTDSTYIFYAESIDKGIVKYSGNKMDIYGKEGVNEGKHFTAIYMFEAGFLNICYNLAGDKYPETFDTKGKPMYFHAVFKKAE